MVKSFASFLRQRERMRQSIALKVIINHDLHNSSHSSYHRPLDCLAYNRLVTMVNRAKEAWADIDVQLKRRYDLIPNLVNTVKGYATHESTAFENSDEGAGSGYGCYRFGR